MGHRGWRGDCLLKLLEAYRLHLPQTFVEGFDTKYTCVGNRHNEPTPIDYMATSAPPHFGHTGKDSRHMRHHLGPLAALLRFETKIRACRPTWRAKTTEAKPIGWQLAELNYNDNAREQVGLDIPQTSRRSCRMRFTSTRTVPSRATLATQRKNARA